MKTTFFNFWNRPRSFIVGSLAVCLALALGIIYFQKSKKTAPETTVSKQTTKEAIPKTVTGTFDCTHCNPVAHTSTEEPEPAKHDLSPLEYAMQRDPRYLTFTTNPDGSKSVHLNGTFRSVTAAKRLPDGTLEIRCIENYDALENFLGASQK